MLGSPIKFQSHLGLLGADRLLDVLPAKLPAALHGSQRTASGTDYCDPPSWKAWCRDNYAKCQLAASISWVAEKTYVRHTNLRDDFESSTQD